MRLKTLLTALALSLAPGFALAMGCGFENATDTASQCTEGQIWDAATESCVDSVS